MELNPSHLTGQSSSSEGYDSDSDVASTRLEKSRTVTSSSDKTLANLKHVSFAPFGGGDVFSHCAALNVSRKPDKGFVPVVPDCAATKAQLKQGKAKMLADYQALGANCVQKEAAVKQAVATVNASLIQVADARTRAENGPLPMTAAETKSYDDAMKSLSAKKLEAHGMLESIAKERAGYEKLIDAANATKILSPERKLSELPKGAIVDLPGHGGATRPYLATVEKPTKDQTIAMKEVARKLGAAGLQEDTKLKLRACHSADAKASNTFVANPPSAITHWFDPTETAPAKTLADELHEQKVPNRGVFGYQGVGKAFAKVNNENYLRENGAGDQVRASKVRKEFKHNE
jgi:hypothetical protein